MRRTLHLSSTAFTVALLSACATLPAPVVNERFGVNYEALAACSYQAASQEDQTLQFKELRAANTAIISKVMQDVPIWEAKFIGDGAVSTRVEIQAFPTVWGPDVHARPIQATIRSCATARR